MLFSRGKTYVTDFVTLADGRIVALPAQGLLAGRLIAPDPEVYQNAHDSVRERARATLAQLQQEKELKVAVVAARLEGEELIRAARKHRARIVTTATKPLDAGDVPVTYLDRLYDMLKPAYLPGAELAVRIVKKGKKANEGVGYVDGNIKVIVENGADMIDKDAEVVIIGGMDSDKGRTVFARPKYVDIR